MRTYHYKAHYAQLREHLAAFLNAYNISKRLKTLKGLTPISSSAQTSKNTPIAS